MILSGSGYFCGYVSMPQITTRITGLRMGSHYERLENWQVLRQLGMQSFPLYESKKQAELIEGYHMTDFFRAAPASFQQEHGLSVEESACYIATVAESEEFKFYNRVYAPGVASPITESEVEHLIDLYGQAGLPFVTPVSPEAQPPELARWLEARGFTVGMRTARFFRGLEETVSLPERFRVSPVNATTATQFASIACQEQHPLLQQWLLATLGRAGWHHYVAMEDETPIASGVLFVRGEVGWLGWASTLPLYRRRGAHQALLAHRIREARRFGCRLLSAETREDTAEETNSSYHNLLRAGFQFAYLRPHYVYQPPSPSTA